MTMSAGSRRGSASSASTVPGTNAALSIRLRRAFSTALAMLAATESIPVTRPAVPASVSSIAPLPQ